MAKPSAFAKLKQAPEPPVRSAADAPVVRSAPDVPVADGLRPRQASRIGRKTVIFYDMPDAVRALKQIGLDQERTLQDLMHEALDDLLVKHGKVPFGPR